ncbi:MAG: hypothetical protein V3V99_09445 [candidate division Zixibacteria bacterium]
MSTTLAYLRGRRAWLIENLSVWGVDNDAEFFIAALEVVGSDKRIGFWKISLGGQQQEITFSNLIDNRGNSLPAAIKKPAIVIIPRSSQGAFIKNVSGDSGFTIVRNDEDSAPALVDLLIFEIGA